MDNKDRKKTLNYNLGELNRIALSVLIDNNKKILANQSQQKTTDDKNSQFIPDLPKIPIEKDNYLTLNDNTLNFPILPNSIINNNIIENNIIENNITITNNTAIKKKLVFNKKNFFFSILFCIGIISLITSITLITKWLIDNHNISEQIDNIKTITKITEIEDNNDTQIVENDVSKSDPYWDYIKMNLIRVNINELKKVNNDTIGWLKVEGTNINYPFVQANNNEYYLNHDFYKKSNGSGWVFMDYRNNNFSDKNTIIYAHGRQNQTMFGSLKNILKSEWLSNINNHVIKLSTDSENSLWQVFSVYRIPTTSDYLKVNFDTDEEFLDFTNKIINRSQHNFNTSVSSEDKILTLSTCYNNDDKVVLHAKLIKKE